MNILLINPKTPSFIDNKEYYIPSSLLYLASSLQKDGKNVDILDLNTFMSNDTESILINKISNMEYSLIGITCLFSGHYPLVSEYSRIIKHHLKSIPIVIGGIHPTLFPYEILYNCPTIDYIILGEGELSLVELSNVIYTKYTAKYEFHNNLSKIDGFAYRYNDKIEINTKKLFIEDLDSIPISAYNLINLKDYYHNTTNWHNPKNLSINCSIPIISSRSCPMKCNFCSMFNVMGSKHRKRTPKNVVDEIELLYNKYNHRYFSFMDDNLTLDKSHVTKICNEIINRNLNIQFDTPNGISIKFLDEGILDLLVSAGLVRVSLAIESGSDYIRNNIMGKKLSRKKIFEIVKLTKKYKSLYVRAFFIMGTPEETNDTLMETYNMIQEIDVDKPIVSTLIPFPGTRLFEQCLKDKLFIDDINPADLWKTKDLYFTKNNRFFIKPYNLEIDELYSFKNKFDVLIKELIDKKIRERKFL